MKRFLLFLIVGIRLFGAELYEGKIVEKIEITVKNLDAESSYNSSIVLGKLKTKVGDPFSQTTFDNDLKAIFEDFDRIEPEVSLSQGKISININVWIRPVIRKIDWKGNRKISTHTLQKELGVKTGSVFNRPEFNKALNKVKEYYLKKGFFESEVNYSITPDPKKNEILVDISIQEGRYGRVKDIIFKGFTPKEESEVLKLINTKKFNIFITWLTGRGIFKEDVIDQDQAVIVNLLQNKGYADARVTIKVTEDPKTEKITVEITADHGDLYHFGKVTFEGNTAIDDSDILKAFTIHSQDLYSQEQIRNTAQAVKELYGEKGFIEAEVTYDIRLHENQTVYDIDFHIKEGDPYRIGLIKIFGNVQTSSKIILRESLIVPGEIFDSRKLKATQERLENIGYFKSVNVYSVKSLDDAELGPNYRDVYIEVEETTTGSAAVTIGASGMTKITLGIDIKETNFNHKGFFHSGGPSALRGGGEFLQISANVGDRQQNGSITWMTPYVGDSKWRFGFETSYSSSSLESKDYRLQTYGITLFTSYPITNWWTFGMRERCKYLHNHVKAKIGSEGQREGNISGLISAPSASLTYDSTDNPLKAHRGIRTYWEAEFAGLGGDFHFLKFSLINTCYSPLWKKGTMKYRGNLVFMQPVLNQQRTRIPLSERLFLGGETTVRGYKPYSLGPHFNDHEKDPEGGVTSALLSVEYNQEIVSVASIFVFADAGSISQRCYGIARLRASTGIGIRAELTSKMPMMIGWGYPINPERHGDRQELFFSMEGRF